MTATVKRMTLGFGAGLIALTAVAGVFVQAQDQSQDPQAQTRGQKGRGPGGPDGPRRFGGPGGPMGILPMLGHDLGLTDAQRDQVKAIAESHKADWRALADRARTAHMALNEAVTTAPIDEALIRQKSSELAAVDADLAVARARAHAEVFQILTAEQKEKAKARKLEGRGRK
jgi:Spy/CpxP family protein refolding chaperone